MTLRVEQVVKENGNLHLELCKNLESQIQSIESGKSSSHSNSDDVLNKMQQEMKIISRERDKYHELFQQTSMELDQMRKNLQVRSNKNE